MFCLADCHIYFSVGYLPVSELQFSERTDVAIYLRIFAVTIKKYFFFVFKLLSHENVQCYYIVRD